MGENEWDKMVWLAIYCDLQKIKIGTEGWGLGMGTKSGWHSWKQADFLDLLCKTDCWKVKARKTWSAGPHRDHSPMGFQTKKQPTVWLRALKREGEIIVMVVHWKDLGPVGRWASWKPFLSWDLSNEDGISGTWVGWGGLEWGAWRRKCSIKILLNGRCIPGTGCNSKCWSTVCWWSGQGVVKRGSWR